MAGKHGYTCKDCAKEKIKLRTKNNKELRIANRIILENEVYIGVTFAPDYEVSNLGNIFNIKRAVQLNPSLNDGYLMGKLYLTKSIKKSISVHRLVAISFLENLSCLPEVNHKDGNKQNNRKDNLEWSTTKNNINHAIEIGLRTRDINLRKGDLFDKEKIKKIFSMASEGVSDKKIAEFFNCHNSTINKIKKGKHYPHLSKEFFL